jgi:hypothetical protein
LVSKRLDADRSFLPAACLYIQLSCAGVCLGGKLVSGGQFIAICVSLVELLDSQLGGGGKNQTESGFPAVVTFS